MPVKITGRLIQSIGRTYIGPTAKIPTDTNYFNAYDILPLEEWSVGANTTPNLSFRKDTATATSGSQPYADATVLFNGRSSVRTDRLGGVLTIDSYELDNRDFTFEFSIYIQSILPDLVTDDGVLFSSNLGLQLPGSLGQFTIARNYDAGAIQPNILNFTYSLVGNDNVEVLISNGFVVDSWNELVVERYKNILRFYRNGQRMYEQDIGNAKFYAPAPSSPWQFGTSDVAGSYDTNLANVRMTLGSARYRAPLTYTPNGEAEFFTAPEDKTETIVNQYSGDYHLIGNSLNGADDIAGLVPVHTGTVSAGMSIRPDEKYGSFSYPTSGDNYTNTGVQFFNNGDRFVIGGFYEIEDTTASGRTMLWGNYLPVASNIIALLYNHDTKTFELDINYSVVASFPADTLTDAFAKLSVCLVYDESNTTISLYQNRNLLGNVVVDLSIYDFSTGGTTLKLGSVQIVSDISIDNASAIKVSNFFVSLSQDWTTDQESHWNRSFYPVRSNEEIYDWMNLPVGNARPVMWYPMWGQNDGTTEIVNGFGVHRDMVWTNYTSPHAILNPNDSLIDVMIDSSDVFFNVTGSNRIVSPVIPPEYNREYKSNNTYHIDTVVGSQNNSTRWQVTEKVLSSRITIVANIQLLTPINNATPTTYSLFTWGNAEDGSYSIVYDSGNKRFGVSGKTHINSTTHPGEIYTVWTANDSMPKEFLEAKPCTLLFEISTAPAASLKVWMNGVFVGEATDATNDQSYGGQIYNNMFFQIGQKEDIANDPALYFNNVTVHSDWLSYQQKLYYTDLLAYLINNPGGIDRSVPDYNPAYPAETDDSLSGSVEFFWPAVGSDPYDWNGGLPVTLVNYNGWGGTSNMLIPPMGRTLTTPKTIVFDQANNRTATAWDPAQDKHLKSYAYIDNAGTLLNFGTGAFCIEMFCALFGVGASTSTNNNVVFSFGGSPTFDGGLRIRMNREQRWEVSIHNTGDGNWTNIITTGMATAKQWGEIHLAFTFDGTTYNIYQDGVLLGTYNTTQFNITPAASTTFFIGTDAHGSPDAGGGYYSDYRITKGDSRYTGAFNKLYTPLYHTARATPTPPVWREQLSAATTVSDGVGFTFVVLAAGFGEAVTYTWYNSVDDSNIIAITTTGELTVVSTAVNDGDTIGVRATTVNGSTIRTDTILTVIANAPTALFDEAVTNQNAVVYLDYEDILVDGSEIVVNAITGLQYVGGFNVNTQPPILIDGGLQSLKTSSQGQGVIGDPSVLFNQHTWYWIINYDGTATGYILGNQGNVDQAATDGHSFLIKLDSATQKIVYESYNGSAWETLESSNTIIPSNDTEVAVTIIHAGSDRGLVRIHINGIEVAENIDISINQGTVTAVSIGTELNSTVPIYDNGTVGVTYDCTTIIPVVSVNIDELHKSYKATQGIAFVVPLFTQGLSAITSLTDGQETTLTVEAYGDGLPVTYQWYNDGILIKDSTDSTYTDSFALSDDGTVIEVFATNSVGIGISTTTTTLNVASGSSIPDPNFNNVVSLMHYDGDVTDVTGKAWALNSTAVVSSTVAKFGIGSLDIVTGDTAYLSTPNHVDFDFGSDDFTIELWTRFDSLNTEWSQIIGKRVTVDTYSPFLISYNGTALAFNLSETGSAFVPNGVFLANVLQIDTWYYLTMSRVGNSVYCFVDGLLVGTIPFANTLFANTASVYIGGGETGQAPFNRNIKGYVDDVRITKGIGRYTTAFLPPTAPHSNINAGDVAIDPFWNTVASLLHADDDLLDPAGNTWTSSVSTQPNQVQGISNGALTFNGTDDEVSVAHNQKFVADGNYTAECYINFVSLNAASDVFVIKGTTTAYDYLIQRNGGVFELLVKDNGAGIAVTITGTTTVAINQWYHVAVVRTNSASEWRLWIDGVQEGGSVIEVGTPNAAGGSLTLGSAPGDATRHFTGLMDGFRVTEDIRYTTDFVPPALPHGETASDNVAGYDGAPAIWIPYTLQDTDVTELYTRVVKNTSSAIATFAEGSVQLAATSAFALEFTINAVGDGAPSVRTFVGLKRGVPTAAGDTDRITWRSNGAFRIYGVETTIATYTDNDILTFVFNAGNIWVAKNGVWQSGNPVTGDLPTATGIVGSDLRAFFTTDNVSAQPDVTLNAGQKPFAYVPFAYEKGMRSTTEYIPITPVVTKTDDLYESVELQLHFDTGNGGSIIDEVAGHTWTIFGSAAIDGNDTVFGQSSFASLAGFNGAKLSNSLWNGLGSGEFTIEFWYKPSGTAQPNARIFQTREGDLYTGLSITDDGAGQLGVYLDDDGVGSWLLSLTPIVLTNNVWQHICVERVIDTVTVYHNGASVANGSFAATPFWDTGDVTIIGGQETGTQRSINSNLDDLRLTTGVARYGAPFTVADYINPDVLSPQTIEEFDPWYDTVTSLLHFNGSAGDTIVTDSTGLTWVLTNLAEFSDIKTKFGTTSLYVPSTTTSYAQAVLAPAIGLGDFTLELQLNVTTLSNAAPIVDYRTQNATGIFPLLIITNSGLVAFNVNGTDEITSTTVIRDNMWHHIAVTKEAGTTKLWINGVQEGGNYADTNDYLVGTEGLLLGGQQHSNSDKGINGFIDEFRISTISRYDATFTPLLIEFANNDTGLPRYEERVLRNDPTHYWRMNETSGTVAYDSTLNDYHSLITGTLVTDNSGLGSVFQSGMAFTASYFTTSDPAAYLASTGIFTIAFWAKTNIYNSENRGGVVGHTLGTIDSGFGVSFDSRSGAGYDNALVYTVSDGVSVVNIAQWDLAIPDANIHFYTLVGDGTNVTLYVDGIVVSAKPVAPLNVPLDDSLTFGAVELDNTVYYADSTLLELSLHDGMIDAAEIAVLYEYGIVFVDNNLDQVEFALPIPDATKPPILESQTGQTYTVVDGAGTISNARGSFLDGFAFENNNGSSDANNAVYTFDSPIIVASDFTIEFHTRIDNDRCGFLDMLDGATRVATFYHWDWVNGTLRGKLNSLSGAPTTNIENTNYNGVVRHFAWVREGDNWSVYIDGTLGDTVTGATGSFNITTLYCGRGYPGAARGLSGSLDNIRFTNGTARYVSNFTPPPKTYPTPLSVSGPGDVSI